MKRSQTTVGILLVLLLFAVAAVAETRYVSDTLIVTVRENMQSGAKVLATVRSDDPVEVLEELDGQMKIRTSDGTVGYIQAQYITAQTPSPIVIERLEKERDRLKARVKELQDARTPQAEELDRLRNENARLENAVAATKTELETLREKYEHLRTNSEQVVEIIAERDRLQQHNNEMTAELSQLETENEQLLRSGMIRWFLAGGGVFLVGWIIGKFSRKKRRY